MAIVGGMFGLDDPPARECPPPPFLREGSVLLANARSGIMLLIEQFSPRRVWMPSYLCHTMLMGIRRTPVEFYGMDYDLRMASSDWIGGVGSGDLVVVIDYFGWPCESDLVQEIRRRGAWVLEDACQAMLTETVGRSADYTLFSPRKFVGIPDGGILTANNGADGLAPTDLAETPADWWLEALSALVLRREFDIHGGSRRWYDLYREAEAINPVGLYAMSGLSRTLLMHGFDYQEIAARRIANYLVLGGMLRELALFRDLPPRVVPLGFPIRLKDRDRVREALFRHEIYPPVHWPIAGVVPERFEESHALAADIMMLPCDQRYTEDDMRRVASLLLKELEQ